MSEYVPDKRAKNTRVGQVELEDGRQGWEYTDGSIRDNDGRLMKRHPNGAPPITPANSAQYRELRSMKHARAVGQGVLNSARKHGNPDGIPTTLHAWKYVIEHLMDAFFDKATKPRDKAEIVKVVGLHLDAVPARVPAASSQQVAGLPAEDVQTMRFVLSRVRAVYQNKKADQSVGYVEG